MNNGCCGAGARVRLTQAARTQLESALWSELSKLADTLTNRAIKFDGKSETEYRLTGIKMYITNLRKYAG